VQGSGPKEEKGWIRLFYPSGVYFGAGRAHRDEENSRALIFEGVPKFLLGHGGSAQGVKGSTSCEPSCHGNSRKGLRAHLLWGRGATILPGERVEDGERPPEKKDRRFTEEPADRFYWITENGTPKWGCLLIVISNIQVPHWVYSPASGRGRRKDTHTTKRK